MNARESDASGAKHSRILTMAVAGVLILTALATTLNAYIAGVALLAWLAHEQWGTTGVLTTILACLALTALIAFVAGRVYLRRAAPSPAPPAPSPAPVLAQHQPPSTAPESPWARALQTLVGTRISSESWVTAASLVAVTAALIGPLRLVRLLLRGFVIARTLRATLGQEPPPAR